MKIIAHRGASGYAPENTKVAMVKAIEMDVDGFEVDLQLTIGGEIVVFHDWTLDRTTDGRGYLKTKTLEELKDLDSGSWFSEGKYHEEILTLNELLEIIPKSKILNLEIKVLRGDSQEIENKVVKILEKAGRIDENIIISSFNHEIIKNINKLNSELKVGLLITAGFLNIGNYIKNNNLNIFSIHSSSEFITLKFLKEMKSLGIKNYVWTVNNVEEGKILKDLGVDAIITNYPDRFKNII